MTTDMTTEQQINGHGTRIPTRTDVPVRPSVTERDIPAPADDLDVPEFLHDVQDAVPDDSVNVAPDVAEPAGAVAVEARRPFHRVRTVAGHRVTRGAARQAVYVGAGVGHAHRHLRDERTTSRHHRAMRAAEAVGDHAVALLWEERASQHRAARHARRMALLHTPVHAAKAVTYATATAAGVLLLVGVCLAAADRDPGEAAAPLMTAVDVVRFVVTLASILWAPAVLTAVFAGLTTLWALGRRRAELPAWLAPPGQPDTGGAPITPSVVVVALRDLGIAELRKAVKAAADGAAAMLGPIRIAGCGVEVDVTLPSGVSTIEVQNRRRKLAENLGRHEHEVFITIPPAARTVRLWIADSGALDEPIGPSPLVIEPELVADLYTGRAPWGQDLRGGAALISLMQRHLLITGLSNQGKTAALRALVLWAALDPCTELRLADLKGVGDWRMLIGLAAVLIQGPTDEHCIAAAEMLEAGVAEMERRLVALEKSGATDGVTRDMARKAGSGFHPLILVVDEAQQAFMCPAIGPDKRPYGGTKATSRYFMAARKIHNQGRAVNVVLWQGTQDPTDQNLPKLVREGAHIRASLVVGTEAQARMALGDKAIDGGAAPHKLRQGLDKGTLVVAGDGVELPPGQSSITIRTHFISGEAAVPIAERAKALRKPVTTRTGTEATAARDVLEDVASVLGFDETLVKSSEVVQRLLDLDPDAYKGWTQNRLSAELAGHAVVPRKTKDGTMHVDHAEVRAAFAAREALSADDPGT